MKKRLALGAAMASIVLAGGCATTSNSGGITIQAVQGAAVALCSYLPTADSVAALLSANAAIMTAEAIAQVVCAAVGTAPAAQSAKLRAVAPVMVMINGKPVTVTGSFVAAAKSKRAH
jgi:hypothetical protein